METKLASGTAKTRVIRALWDDEASVWCATSDDIPGLVAEAATYDELRSILRELVPELLRLNSGIREPVPFKLITEREELVAAHA
jgi:hypothetical protein